MAQNAYFEDSYAFRAGPSSHTAGGKVLTLAIINSRR